MQTYEFTQLDVFSSVPLMGNPLAVVHDADSLEPGRMQQLSSWTNLSETTFLVQPGAGADYGLRIFTPERELPFAGHPTLGSCRAWLDAGGMPSGDLVIQRCAAGDIPIRREGSRLAFRAPPLVRSGPAEASVRDRLPTCIGLPDTAIGAVEWIDNGPGWCGVLLRDVADLRAARPDYTAFDGLKLGLVAPAGPDDDWDFELRAFTGRTEDPVTGSLNASAAQWLFASGIATSDYIAAQGMALGRDGRIHVSRDDGDIWVGGEVSTCISGRITL